MEKHFLKQCSETTFATVNARRKAVSKSQLLNKKGLYHCVFDGR